MIEVFSCIKCNVLNIAQCAIIKWLSVVILLLLIIVMALVHLIFNDTITGRIALIVFNNTNTHRYFNVCLFRMHTNLVRCGCVSLSFLVLSAGEKKTI